MVSVYLDDLEDGKEGYRHLELESLDQHSPVELSTIMENCSLSVMSSIVVV